MVFYVFGDIVILFELIKIILNIFIVLEIVMVGYGVKDVEDGVVDGMVYKFLFVVNLCVKMMGIKDGFVKFIVCKGFGMVIGGVIVVFKVFELIYLIVVVVE